MNTPLQNIRRPAKSVGKGEPPAEPSVVNLHKPTSAGNVQLQFQVPPEIRRAVKAYAAENDLNLGEVFMRCWADFRRNNP